MTDQYAERGRRVAHNRNKFVAAQPEWMNGAVCQGTDVSLWFPDSKDYITINQAKEICKVCPVRLECLDWAYRTGSSDGIFGGMDAKERRNAQRRAQRRSST